MTNYLDRSMRFMKQRILVISNDCFSESSSNGRTLGNLLIGWPKDKLAQFYLNTNTPSLKYCNNYYQVSDTDAIKYTLHCKKHNDSSTIKQDNEGSSSSSIKRNALTMLIRHAVWSLGAWKKAGFYQWVDDFHPQIVLLQAGDCPFMYDLAVSVSKRFDAKLVIYNSEGYYFKNYDYFRSKGIAHLLYPVFSKILKGSLEKAYHLSKTIVYSCEDLKEEYSKVFSNQGEVIYISSSMECLPTAMDHEQCIVSYCGNLGINRHKSLIELANVLHSINETLQLDVYGIIPNDQVKEELLACPSICYKGFVSYEEVKKVMKQSDIIVHAESFDDFYVKDIRFGFSTKIADCLATGKCFLVYAPKSLACSKYLKKYEAAYVASNLKELTNILHMLVNKKSERLSYAEHALKLADKNHSFEKNAEKFQTILLNI